MLDLHSHVVPAGTPFSARLREGDSRWARLEPGGEVIVSGRLFRRVRRVAWDLAERREQLTAAGVCGQLLSAMPELFAPWAETPDALSRCPLDGREGENARRPDTRRRRPPPYPPPASAR